MKKKKILIGALILIIISLVLFKNYNYKINVVMSNQLWNLYDASISTIENNMELIAEPDEYSDWGKLKDFDIEDDNYEQMLNLVVKEIGYCYMEYTDNSTLDTTIRKYRFKSYIRKKELEDLKENMSNEDGCLNRFFYANYMWVNQSTENTQRYFYIFDNIKKLYLYKEATKNNTANYDKLLLQKVTEVHMVADISEYLKNEYIRLK